MLWILTDWMHDIVWYVFTFLAATSNSTAFWYWACFMKKSEQRASKAGSLVSFRSSAISCRAPNCSVAKASSKALETWPAWKGGMDTCYISNQHHLVVKFDTTRIWILSENVWKYLMIKHNSSVHVRSFLFIIHGRVHHVFWIAKQRQIHELLVQVILFTQSDGVVIGLCSCVEVHRLADFILSLVLPCNMIRRCSVARLIGYLTRLRNIYRSTWSIQYIWILFIHKWKFKSNSLNIPSECFLDNSARVLETGNPGRRRSNAVQPPCLIGSPDNDPTTYTDPCPITHQTTDSGNIKVMSDRRGHNHESCLRTNSLVFHFIDVDLQWNIVLHQHSRNFKSMCVWLLKTIKWER